MLKEDKLLSMNIHKAILILAVPSMGSMILHTVFDLVDAYWVGKLGTSAFAGVGSGSFIIWTIFSVADIVSVGGHSLVARFTGAKDREMVKSASFQSFVMITIISLLSAIILIPFLDSIFKLMGLADDVRIYAYNYLFIYLLGGVIVFAFFVAGAIFRGSGDSITPTIITIFCVSFNAILDPFLIFGWWIAPSMGVAGAALATVIANGIGSIISIYLLFKRDLIPIPKKIIDVEMIFRIAKIGAPIAFSGILFSIVYVVLTRIISHFGTAPIAAIGFGHRIEGIVFFACIGFSMASSTLVGQNLGAKRPDQAEKSVWITIGYMTVVISVVSLFFIFRGGWLVSLFTNDIDVIKEGANYLRIIGFFELFLGFEIIMEGAFSGAGDTIPAMIIGVTFTVIRIPLAYLLAIQFNIGSSGIWWAISISTAIKGILFTIWFKRGKWKKKKV